MNPPTSSEQTSYPKILNACCFLLVMVIIGWLLVIGSSLLIPLILAVMLWYILDTMASYLQNLPIGSFRIPYALALTGAFIVSLVVLILVVDMVASNASELSKQAPQYQENIKHKLESLLGKVAPNATFDSSKISDLFNLQKLVGWATGVVSSVTSTFILVLIYLMFLFVEQSVFASKFSALFNKPDAYQRAQHVLQDITQKIRIYLSVKTFTSLLTGVVSTLLLLLIGVDYAVFWGFIIFMLNYIPTIGSLLGVLFPAALSLVQFDSSWQFFAVLILLGIVQFIVGNILEPRLMGSSLNLSGLVIMLALAVWGSIWGITGMILSVPITVVIMIVCAQFPLSRPIAILLSQDGKV